MMTKMNRSSAVAFFAAVSLLSSEAAPLVAPRIPSKVVKWCGIEEDCEVNKWCKSKSVEEFCSTQNVDDCPVETMACSIEFREEFEPEEVEPLIQEVEPEEPQSDVPLTELQCPRYMCKCDAYHATTSTSTKRSYTAPGHVPHLRNLLEGEAAPEPVASPQQAAGAPRRSLFQAGGKPQWPTYTAADNVPQLRNLIEGKAAAQGVDAAEPRDLGQIKDRMEYDAGLVLPRKNPIFEVLPASEKNPIFEVLPASEENPIFEVLPASSSDGEIDLYDGSKESRVWYDLKTGVCNWPCKKCPCICM